MLPSCLVGHQQEGVIEKEDWSEQQENEDQTHEYWPDTSNVIGLIYITLGL